MYLACCLWRDTWLLLSIALEGTSVYCTKQQSTQHAKRATKSHNLRAQDSASSIIFKQIAQAKGVPRRESSAANFDNLLAVGLYGKKHSKNIFNVSDIFMWTNGTFIYSNFDTIYN